MLTSRGCRTPTGCSIAIVGAGLAGLELALELEARGVSDVLVLEAGGGGELRHINAARSPDAAARAWLEPDQDDAFRRPWRSLTPPHYLGASGIRQRVGGRSLYWCGVVLPIEPWALTSWPKSVVTDLCDTWRGGVPLYERVETRLRQWRDKDRPQLPLVVDDRTAAVAGLTLRTTPAAVRRSVLNPERWYAYSPLDTWRDPETGCMTGAPRDCRIVEGVEVLRVLRHRDGVCGGVLVLDRDSGETATVTAAMVVLAAGTLENSRLAVQVLTECGGLDKPRLFGLNDHIVQGFFARFTAAQATSVLRRFAPGNYYSPCTVRANVYLEAVALPGGEALLDVRSSGEQLPSDKSFVECLPGTAQPWSYQVVASVSDADREVLAAQREILQRIWDDVAPAAGELHFDDFDQPSRTNSAVLSEHLGAIPAGTAVTWASYLGTEDHEGGTLPIGGLLTAQQEFAAVPELFAVGPSTFPRAGAANPALTMLALAHRVAPEMAARL